MAPTPTHQFDVVVVGSGLAGSAVARSLALAGRSVAFVPGIARSRSLEQDGGVIDPSLGAEAFGDGAPLGQMIAGSQRFAAESFDVTPVVEPTVPMPPRRSFRRLALEHWAQQQAVAAGATYLHDMVEGRVLPALNGSAVLTEEHGERVFEAGVIALCEGADPRIPMRVGLRPDYLPEDQLHFARTIVRHVDEPPMWRYGTSRTSWGMPIGIAVVPLAEDAIVSVSVRIENVMRSERSSKDALDDLMSSPLAAALGIDGERDASGMELVALRRETTVAHLTHDRLVLGLDAAGILDPREPSRADATLRSGMVLGAWLSGPMTESWDRVATPLIRDIRSTHPGWRDDRATGYIEDVDGTRVLSETARRIFGRLRRRDQGSEH